jgi:arsenite methyltransferase
MSTLSYAFDTPSLADHYESVSHGRQVKAGKFLLERLRLRDGEAVLDIGSGTGLVAAHAAALVGPSGTVLGIDPLPLRVEISKERTRRNVAFRVGDAYDLLAFPDETFDVVYLNAVFHWLPEKRSPLRGIRRVLKAGGRLGISTGSKDHLNSLQQVRSDVLKRAPYHEYPESREGVAYHVSAGELEELLESSGFKVRSLELKPQLTYHETPRAALDFAQASSFGNFLGRLPERLRRPAQAEIEAELESSRTPRGIPQRGRRIVAIAVKASEPSS